MMKLTTKCIGVTEDGGYIVAWMVGLQKKGIIVVRNLQPVELVECQAELSVICFLVFGLNVFKREFVTGNGLHIGVSKVEILKLFTSQLAESELYRYGRFLFVTLTGVRVFCIGDDLCESFPTVTNMPESDWLEIDPTNLPRYDLIKAPALGQVRLTKHVIDSYKERNHSGSAKNPVASLVGRLRHPNLKRQVIPPGVLQHKLFKYKAETSDLEMWGHSTSQMHFVIVRDRESSIGTVVTVFRRHPQYM